MRAAGVAEEFCTGDADPYDKYLACGRVLSRRPFAIPSIIGRIWSLSATLV